jgi:hypothetical protein
VSASNGIVGTAGTGPAGLASPPAALAAAAGASGSPATANVATLMEQGLASNQQLLALQMQVQQENQRFTTVSNVMRAKHDTAKAAVSNIRA